MSKQKVEVKEVKEVKEDNVAYKLNILSGNVSPFEGLSVNTIQETKKEQIINSSEKDLPSFGGSNVDVFKKSEIDKVLEEVEEVEEEQEEETKKEEDEQTQKKEKDEALSKKGDEEEVEEEEEVEDVVEEAVEGEEEKLNIYYHLGQQLKKDGELPEDYDISEDISAQEIFNTYKKYIKEDAEAEVKREAVDSLTRQGYNENHLNLAKLLASGVDPNLLHQASKYKILSETDISKTSDEELESLLKSYYLDRNLKDKEIKKFIEDAQLEETVKDVAKEAVEYFEEKSKTIINEQELKAREDRTIAESQANKLISEVNSLIDSGLIGGDKIPDKKEFKRSIFEKDKIIKIQGQDYPVSKLDLFMLKFDNNVEVRLNMFLNYMYKDKIKSGITETAKESAEEEFLSAYRKSVEKSKSTLIKKELKKELNNKTKTLIGDKKAMKFSLDKGFVPA